MKLGKSIAIGFCLVLGIQAQAQNNNVVTIRSAQASDITQIKVTTKANGMLVFENCTKTKAQEETCYAIGRESGYARHELESRLSDLKWKSRLRLGAKIAVPVVAVVLGGHIGASKGVAEARRHSSGDIAAGIGYALGGAWGGIKGMAVGGVAGATGYVLIDQLTEDYSDRAEALAKGLSGQFVVVTTSIHIVIGELSYALSGL